MKTVIAKDSKAKPISEEISFSGNLKLLSWALIILGVILHFRQYLFNRSLWFDEALLANIVFESTIKELFNPLGPSIGFLLVSKFTTNTLGASEYILRLFPFICGIASLFLFYKAAKNFLEPKAFLVALSLFVLSDRLIYYSSEFRQYSGDVAIALLLYIVAVQLRSKQLTISNIILYGVIGAATIWLSHASLFVMAGIGVSVALTIINKKEFSKIGRLLLVYLIWLASFVICYFVILNKLSKREGLLGYWQPAFMPFPPKNLADINWIIESFFKLFQDPVGLPLSGLAAFIFLVGCASMFLKKREDFILLISTLVFPLVASAMHKYPFEGRVILFCVPAVLIFISEGVGRIVFSDKANRAIIGAPLIGLLLFYPVITDIQHLIKPRTYEEIRPVITYAKQNWQEGDKIYLYYGAIPAFKYYLNHYKFNKSDYIEGVTSRDDYNNYMSDLEKVRGNRRVWIIFSHIRNEEVVFIIQHLNRIGRAIGSYGGDGAGVYLYDLSR